MSEMRPRSRMRPAEPIPYTPGEIAGSMVRRFFSDEISKSSAELSYYLLFSSFPVLLLVSTVVSIFQFSQTTILGFLSLLPADFQHVAGPMLTRFIGKVDMWTLAWRIFSLSLLVVYFLSRAMSSLMRNVNRIYRLPNRRGGIGQLLFEVFIAFSFVVVLYVAAILLILGRTISEFIKRYVELPGAVVMFWESGRFFIAFGLIFLFILILGYLSPNCVMRLRDALPGTIFTIATWLVCTMVFTFYVNYINQYDLIYGSISAIMVLLLWMYMTSVIIYLGFEFNYIMMKRRHCNFVCKGQPWYSRLISRHLQRQKGKETEL